MVKLAKYAYYNFEANSKEYGYGEEYITLTPWVRQCTIYRGGKGPKFEAKVELFRIKQPQSTKGGMRDGFRGEDPRINKGTL